MPHPLSNIFTDLHSAIYRRSGGRSLTRMNGVPVLLLTTTGRKSGKRRTTPLMYIEDGNDLIVVGSNAGRATQPGWFWNLQTDPVANVQIGAEQRPMRASFVDGADRDAAWDKFVAAWPTYAKYRARTDRNIPVVRLHKVEA